MLQQEGETVSHIQFLQKFLPLHGIGDETVGNKIGERFGIFKLRQIFIHGIVVTRHLLLKRFCFFEHQFVKWLKILQRHLRGTEFSNPGDAKGFFLHEFDELNPGETLKNQPRCAVGACHARADECARSEPN